MHALIKRLKPVCWSLFTFGLMTLPLSAQGGQTPKKPPTFFEFLLRPKFITMFVIAGIALFLLLSKRMNSRIKVTILLLSTFLYGIAANLPLKLFASFSMHPSPICSVAKAMLYGFRIPMIVSLAVILFLTLVGPKLFCGWICPVGATQELIGMAADKMKIKRLPWNFRLSQFIRVGIFLLFLFVSGTAILHIVNQGTVVPIALYDYVNAFHGFEITLQKTLLDNIIHFLPFILTVVLSFKLYRPFCYLVCPIGLLTNLVEHFAIFRITLVKPPCNDCSICEKKSPCPTVPEIMKEAVVRPDCFACNICVDCCPKSSLEFGTRLVREEKE
ncbi:MAG: 4Fe-4S binding protein [Acidobacteria bacterium]|nr:4Fe-4S binding protein [Acidobacteriota bacterium]